MTIYTGDDADEEVRVRRRALVAALAKVTAELPEVGKHGKAPGDVGGYAFRQIDDVVAALRPLLGRHGLALVPSVRMLDRYHPEGTKPATQEWVIEVTWLIEHAEGGSIVATTIGVGRDGMDKGLPKAMTSAYKGLLLTLFAVSGGDDPETTPDLTATTRASRAAAPADDAPDPHRLDLIRMAKDLRKRLGMTAEQMAQAASDVAKRKVKALDGLSTPQLEQLVGELLEIGEEAEAKADAAQAHSAAEATQDAQPEPTDVELAAEAEAEAEAPEEG